MTFSSTPNINSIVFVLFQFIVYQLNVSVYGEITEFYSEYMMFNKSIMRHKYLVSSYIYLRTNDRQFELSHDNICGHNFTNIFAYIFYFSKETTFVISLFVLL